MNEKKPLGPSIEKYSTNFPKVLIHFIPGITHKNIERLLYQVRNAPKLEHKFVVLKLMHQPGALIVKEKIAFILGTGKNISQC